MRMSERDLQNILAGKKKRQKGQKGVKGPKETDIQNSMRAYLQLHGWFVIRHQQSLGSHKGLSDLTAIKGGWTVYVEAKTAAGSLSEDQQDFRDEILRSGGTYVIGRGIEDIDFLCQDHVELLRMKYAGKCVGSE